MLLRLMPDQITRYWEDISSAMVAAVPPLGKVDQAGLNNLLEAFLLEDLQAWILFEDKDGVALIYALAVTKEWVDIGTKDKSLLIYALWGYTLVPDNLWNEGLETLKNFARGRRCSRVCAFSKIPRIIEITKRLGWETETRLLTLEV